MEKLAPIIGAELVAAALVEKTDPEAVALQVMTGASLLRPFFADRLKVLLRDEGKRHDLVDAVFAPMPNGQVDDDLVRIVDRVEALSAFLATEDGANLLAGYKRAANILRAEQKKNPSEVVTPLPLDGGEAGRGGAGTAFEVGTWEAPPETDDDRFATTPIPGPSPIEGEGSAPEEQALLQAVRKASSALQPLLAAEDFAAAMGQLARLRAPVDAFFEHVLVNDPDPAVRLNRLRLLASLQATANQVADFSLIQG